MNVSVQRRPAWGIAMLGAMGVWFALPVSATTILWDDAGNNILTPDFWSVGANWSPANQVPGSTDDVTMGNLADATNDTTLVDQDFVIKSLDILNGVDVINSTDDGATNGFRLAVFELTQVGGVGSSIVIYPRTSGLGNGFDGGSLIIFPDGLVHMAGGNATTLFLAIAAGGMLTGHGMFVVASSDPSSPPNSGTIRAEGGTLTIESDFGGTFDLDGAEFGVLEAVDGVATLVIDVDIGGDDFSGTVNIDAGNTINFQQVWATDTGAINFNAAGGVGEVSGALLTHGGTTNVNAGIGRFSGPVFFETTSTVNVAAGAALHLDDDATISAGATFAGNGQLVNLTGSTITTEDTATVGVLFENQGTLVIGTSPGELSMEGFEQTPSGTLEIELANVTPGNIDVLTVQGNATLGGTFDVTLINPFEPLPGNTFTILETTFGNVASQFDDANLPVFDGMTLGIVYNPQSVVLEVVEFFSADFDHDGDVDNDDLTK